MSDLTSDLLHDQNAVISLAESAQQAQGQQSTDSTAASSVPPPFNYTPDCVDVEGINLRQAQLFPAAHFRGTEFLVDLCQKPKKQKVQMTIRKAGTQYVLTGTLYDVTDEGPWIAWDQDQKPGRHVHLTLYPPSDADVIDFKYLATKFTKPKTRRVEPQSDDEDEDDSQLRKRATPQKKSTPKKSDPRPDPEMVVDSDDETVLRKRPSKPSKTVGFAPQTGTLLMPDLSRQGHPSSTQLPSVSNLPSSTHFPTATQLPSAVTSLLSNVAPSAPSAPKVVFTTQAIQPPPPPQHFQSPPAHFAHATSFTTDTTGQFAAQAHPNYTPQFVQESRWNQQYPQQHYPPQYQQYSNPFHQFAPPMSQQAIATLPEDFSENLLTKNLRRTIPLAEGLRVPAAVDYPFTALYPHLMWGRDVEWKTGLRDFLDRLAVQFRDPVCRDLYELMRDSLLLIGQGPRPQTKADWRVPHGLMAVLIHTVMTVYVGKAIADVARTSAAEQWRTGRIDMEALFVEAEKPTQNKALDKTHDPFRGTQPSAAETVNKNLLIAQKLDKQQTEMDKLKQQLKAVQSASSSSFRGRGHGRSRH